MECQLNWMTCILSAMSRTLEKLFQNCVSDLMTHEFKTEHPSIKASFYYDFQEFYSLLLIFYFIVVHVLPFILHLDLPLILLLKPFKNHSIYIIIFWRWQPFQVSIFLWFLSEFIVKMLEIHHSFLIFSLILGHEKTASSIVSFLNFTSLLKTWFKGIFDWFTHTRYTKTKVISAHSQEKVGRICWFS